MNFIGTRQCVLLTASRGTSAYRRAQGAALSGAG